MLHRNFDKLVKSHLIVMPVPDPCPGWRIRHPELVEFTGFWLPPEWRKRQNSDFLRNHQP